MNYSSTKIIELISTELSAIHPAPSDVIMNNVKYNQSH